jgi:hypothetical protein
VCVAYCNEMSAFELVPRLLFTYDRLWVQGGTWSGMPEGFEYQICKGKIFERGCDSQMCSIN